MIDFSKPTFRVAKMTCLIRYWPDGTSVPVDEFNEQDYACMSDDYADVDLYDSDAVDKLEEGIKHTLIATYLDQPEWPEELYQELSERME